MKKLILFILLLTSFNIYSQRKVNYEPKDGWILTTTGIAFSIVAIACPDGSEWTNSKQGQNSTIVTKPWYTNPARDIMLGIGITFSISGLIYNYNK